MSTPATASSRLSIMQAAFVVARRDFTAILFSRAFMFFLLGPLFPLLVGALAGGIGASIAQQAEQPKIGIAMEIDDREAMLTAYDELQQMIGPAIPGLTSLDPPGEDFDAEALLRERNDLAAVVSGTLQAPVLTATETRLDWWDGPISLIAAKALQAEPSVYPPITTQAVATSGAQQRGGQLKTAQAAQVLLFLLIMMLAGMVLSNLVEEKGNKVIEILAAAIPMDAVFFGKLFAMLGVSIVGITVWGAVGTGIALLGGSEGPIADFLNGLPTPAIGWPLFFLFGVIYFGMGYLLLGSLFLAIGSMAATVREVQTLSMPVTMGQLLVFFFAQAALTDPGGWVEKAALVFPLSSPFAMLAEAAQDGALWPHAIAIAWQAVCVAIFVKLGANMFRKRVMKSGPASGKKQRRSLFRIIADSRKSAAT
jgi:ABC-2 type transport system permease protein